MEGEVVHRTANEARDDFGKTLFQLAKEETWMVAAWRVKDGKLERVKVTTWRFPDGDFAIAAEQLRKHGEEQVQRKALLPDDPLPMADFLKGMGKDVVEVEDEKTEDEKPFEFPCDRLRSPFDD